MKLNKKGRECKQPPTLEELEDKFSQQQHNLRIGRGRPPTTSAGRDIRPIRSPLVYLLGLALFVCLAWTLLSWMWKDVQEQNLADEELRETTFGKDMMDYGSGIFEEVVASEAKQPLKVDSSVDLHETKVGDLHANDARQIIVFLAAASTKALKIFLVKQGEKEDNQVAVWDVCTTMRRDGESERAAAQRILTNLSGLRGPPEIEFLQSLATPTSINVKRTACESANGGCALFVAMVQEVRLSMRGMGPVKMFISRGEMVHLDTLMENVEKNGKNYSSWIQMGLPYVHEYLHPWILTSGKDAKSACTSNTRIMQGSIL